MSMTIVMMIMTIGNDADCYDHDDLSEILVCSVITRRVAVVHLAS